MSEIEDMAACGSGFKDIVDGAVHRFSTGYEAQRVKISLQNQMVGKCGCRPFHINAMIKTDSIDIRFVAIGNKPLTNAFREPDDRLPVAAGPQTVNDMIDRINHHFLPQMGRYSTGPT